MPKRALLILMLLIAGGASVVWITSQVSGEEADAHEHDAVAECAHDAYASCPDDDHAESKGAADGCAGDDHGHADAACADDGHDDHAEHADDGHGHGHAEVAVLSEAQIKANNIRVAEVGRGSLSGQIALPGEIRLNSDCVAHVVPRVGGVVREVFKTVGDDVKAGDSMAVLESRELASLKAEYLGAIEREALAQVTYRREKDLWEKRISAEQDFLSAKQALAEASISTQSAEQQLHAVGFSEQYLKALSKQAKTSYTRYEITAPFDGAVIEKHIVLGESLKDDTSCFTIADLNSVWVNLSVYQKDISVIEKGQPVFISATGDPTDGVATEIAYIGPLVGEETRTALARVVLPNESRRWRPGPFVTGFVSTENTAATSIVVPKTALQTYEGRATVFIETGEGFVPKNVTVGRSNDTHVEVVDGLEAGTRVVVDGSFVIKAELVKGMMEGKTCSGH